jgi:flagellar motility protein MotE (MotC chaperone)
MEEEKSHVRAIVVTLLVIFLVGLFAGYYFWGYRKQLHPDYKEMLKQTISYISTLEEKNQEFTGKVSALENEVASLKKQQSVPEESQMARLNERLSVLEKENADLKTTAGQNEALVQENQQLRQRVQTLVEQMNSRPSKALGNAPVQLPPPQGTVP